jgi:23S rRNA (adenine2030-N6)-methyltransferase
VQAAFRRFATGVYLVWYPVKSPPAAVAFRGEVMAGGVTKALDIAITVPAPEGKLGQANLLVINPPFGLDAQMREILGIVGPRLGGTATLTEI